jgi:hypothetical protein
MQGGTVTYMVIATVNTETHIAGQTLFFGGSRRAKLLGNSEAAVMQPVAAHGFEKQFGILDVLASCQLRNARAATARCNATGQLKSNVAGENKQLPTENKVYKAAK